MTTRPTIVDLADEHVEAVAGLLAARHEAQRRIEPAFVAEREGEVVGSAVGCAIELSSTHTSLALPSGAAFLGFAAVFPEKRGGAGRALGEQVLAWARDAGYAHVVTDWRMTNLTSSRTWPRLGFRPTFYRLFRAIA
jgi:predicted N-acetyltransferase YhbS